MPDVAESSTINKMFLVSALTKNARNIKGLTNILQKSRIPLATISTTSVNSKKFENTLNLPCLPVPKLEDTLEKFIRSAIPFLSEEELCKTKEVAKCFQCGVGQELQKILVDKAKKTENWLDDWWINVAYLDYRDPVVVYSSPGLVFPPQNFTDEMDRLFYTAKLIIAALEYKKLIDCDGIPIDKMGKANLDMNQYKKVFGTCRIPGKRDKLEFHSDSKHVVIVRNNNFFKLNVLGPNNELPSVRQVLCKLNDLVKESEKSGSSVGVLTSQHRDCWYKAYKDLVCDKDNKASVDDIQKSLFLVCLDKAMNGPYKTTAGKQCVHGGGSKENSANRWFDKTIQFIIGENGTVGLTYEHSPSEGQPIAVMTDYLVTYIDNNKSKDIPDAKDKLELKKLDFNVDSRLKTAITEANTHIDKLVANYELEGFQFTGYGKNFIKSQKLSPDSFLQMAMQYAFYRIHKIPGAHYESAATRVFIHGRTETIRSCSCESVAFAKAMLDKNKCDAEKVEALRVAVEGHKKYSIMAVSGFGVDRHLLGLKLAAGEICADVSDFYNDPAYTRTTRMRLSTSQVATKCDGLMCYGALTVDGYGCCYNPRDEDMNFGISAFNEHPDTSACNFKDALVKSLCEMYELLCKTQKAKM